MKIRWLTVIVCAWGMSAGSGEAAPCFFKPADLKNDIKIVVLETMPQLPAWFQTRCPYEFKDQTCKVDAFNKIPDTNLYVGSYITYSPECESEDSLSICGRETILFRDINEGVDKGKIEPIHDILTEKWDNPSQMGTLKGPEVIKSKYGQLITFVFYHIGPGDRVENIAFIKRKGQWQVVDVLSWKNHVSLPEGFLIHPFIMDWTTMSANALLGEFCGQPVKALEMHFSIQNNALVLERSKVREFWEDNE